jgi:hypothetical protein
MLDWLTADSLTWAIRLLHISAVGQTLFVLIWATLPWWRTFIGRALMVKSVALMLYLDWSVLVYHYGPFNNQNTIGLLLFAFITVGILTQLSVLSREVHKARKARNERST